MNKEWVKLLITDKVTYYVNYVGFQETLIKLKIILTNEITKYLALYMFWKPTLVPQVYVTYEETVRV